MQIDTEYNLGDKVWVMFKNRPAECEIKKIILTGSTEYVEEEYVVNHASFLQYLPARKFYKTRQLLLESLQ